MDRVDALMEILPYVQAFQGHTFVVKLGGELCRDEYLENIVKQLSLVNHLGVKLVLVHGGGPQLSQLLDQLGAKTTVIGGRRVTDSVTLRAAKMVFAGELGTNIVAVFGQHGVKAIGLSGVDSDCVRAVRRPPMIVETGQGETEAIDFENVGDITGVDRGFLQQLLSQGLLPVIASLASDGQGGVLNVNADSVAAAVAGALGAQKLIVMTNVAGILRDINEPSSLVSYADSDTVNNMITRAEIKGGMLPKVQGCLKALAQGVERAHIIDGTRRESLLLELFSNDGVGTMLVREQQMGSVPFTGSQPREHSSE